MYWDILDNISSKWCWVNNFKIIVFEKYYSVENKLRYLKYFLKHNYYYDTSIYYRFRCMKGNVAINRISFFYFVHTCFVSRIWIRIVIIIIKSSNSRFLMYSSEMSLLLNTRQLCKIWCFFCFNRFVNHPLHVYPYCFEFSVELFILMMNSLSKCNYFYLLCAIIPTGRYI